MALQDLTPQLRTRLSRMEKAVGWFVLLATLLLLFGFGYYVYNTAENKGWFKRKATYYTYVHRATGLHAGDPVQMMGFTVGQISLITAESADDFEHDVYLQFFVQEPYIGYMWTRGSRAQVTSADLLGKRVLEVTKGTNGYPTYLFNPYKIIGVTEARALPEMGKWKLAQEFYDASGTNLLVKALQPLTVDDLRLISSLGTNAIRIVDGRETRKSATGVWNDKLGLYDAFTGKNYYGFLQDETPALTERAEKLVSEIEKALPSFLNLTNDLTATLSNATRLASSLGEVSEQVKPAISNLNVITAQLKNPKGSLGEWLIPTNLNSELEKTLIHANLTMTNANTNLVAVAEGLTKTLDGLSGITSNLNLQVQANTNILKQISDIIVHSDEFVQGLKRHWLLRSAFKTPKTNAPPDEDFEINLSPRARSQRQ